MNIPKPSVFEFLNLQSFLQAYYTYRKTVQRGFSYEVWIQEMGLEVSRSFLRLVVIGKKRAPSGFVEAFCRQALASEAEVDYFHYLVKYSESKTTTDRQAFAQKLLQIARTQNHQMIHVATPALVEGALPLRLLTLIGFDDLVCNAENLAKLMAKPVEIIESALQKLADLGMAESFGVGEQKCWKAIHEKLRIKENKGSVDLMKFHEQSLLDAVHAFHQPKNLRKYKSLMLALSMQDLEEFYHRMDEFSSEQFSRYNSNSYRGKRLFQINLNVHPISQPEED